VQSFTDQMLMLAPTSRSTLDFAFSSSTVTHEGEMASFTLALYQLSDVSVPK